MNQYKFRVWEPNIEAMIYKVSVGYSPMKGFSHIGCFVSDIEKAKPGIKEEELDEFGWIIDDNWATLELKSELTTQYVNISDVHGREYAFGDIVHVMLPLANEQYQDAGYGVLIWMDDCLGIGTGPINNYTAEDQVKKGVLEWSEIVGNIFEHPDFYEKLYAQLEAK